MQDKDIIWNEFTGINFKKMYTGKVAKNADAIAWMAFMLKLTGKRQKIQKVNAE